VTTSGAQSYGDPVTLGTTTSLSGDTITFGSTLDGAVGFTAQATTLTTFTGAVVKRHRSLPSWSSAPPTSTAGWWRPPAPRNWDGPVTLGQTTNLTGKHGRVPKHGAGQRARQRPSVHAGDQPGHAAGHAPC